MFLVYSLDGELATGSEVPLSRWAYAFKVWRSLSEIDSIFNARGSTPRFKAACQHAGWSHR
jgi:hypothetical protein